MKFELQSPPSLWTHREQLIRESRFDLWGTAHVITEQKCWRNIYLDERPQQLTCSAEAMQPGNRIMTSIQMWKGHQFNTLTAWQKMMAAQQENISQDNCMWKERIIKHNAIWAEEGFFFLKPTLYLGWEPLCLKPPSILFHLKNILIKGKRQCGLKWPMKHTASFLTNPGDAARDFWQAWYCFQVEKSGCWSMA